MGANNVVGVSHVGNRTIVENVGAKRILGSQLVSIGKMPNWVYYLADIDSICVYANQGSNVWIGAFGQPVAGSVELRDSLTPFEGQKYYVVDTDISYTYAGGAWEGGAIRANKLAPKFVAISAPTVLTRGRSHVVLTNTDIKLPKNSSAAEGDTLTGHFFELYVPRGVSANLTAQAPDVFISNEGADTTQLVLAGGTLYTGIFKGGKWEVVYLEVAKVLQVSNNLSDLKDAAEARANLDVPSTSEVAEAIAEVEQSKLDNTVDVSVGAGLVKTGELATGLTLSVDFASPSEAVNPLVVDKAISPATVGTAVSEASRVSQFNSITGLLPKPTDPKFLMTQATANTVSYPTFTVAFNTDPYLKTAPLTVVTFPAGTLTLPAGAGVEVHRVKATSGGSVVLAPTRPLHSSTSECFLGTIVALDGNVAISPVVGAQILNTPWLASSDYSLRATETSLTGAICAPAATVGTVLRGEAHIVSEGVNWETSTLDPHSQTLPLLNPMPFTYLDDTGVVVGAVDQYKVNGSVLGDGSNVPTSKFSIQIAYITSEGLVGVLLGQVLFDTLTDALAATSSYTPNVPSLLSNTLEFSRWVVKGDQYEGHAGYDLTNADNFVISSGSAVSGSSTSNNASDITSSNVNNDLASTNLQEQVDELAGRGLKRWNWSEVPSPTPVEIEPNTRIIAYGDDVYTFKSSYTAKDEIIIHCFAGAYDAVILNPSLTVVGSADSLLPNENLILYPGNTVHLVAYDATTLEIV